MSTRESAATIEEAAIRWLWRLDGEVGSTQIHEDLEAWLAGDDRRRGALLKAQATWLALDRDCLTPLAEAATPARTRGVNNRRWIASIAASAAGIAAFAFSIDSGTTYATALGEVRQVPLQDGSIAALNTQSELEVAISDRVRLIELDRGEVWFKVAKNADKTFLVEVGDVRVMATGTAFSVRRLQGGAEVVVTEGTVEVWLVGREATRAILTAGDIARIGEDQQVVSAEPVDYTDQRLAWRAGKIELAGRTLAEGIAEFNRYNQQKLVLSDPSLANKRLFGVFNMHDAKGFARAVQQAFNAPVDFTDPKKITIGTPS